MASKRVSCGNSKTLSSSTANRFMTWYQALALNMRKTIRNTGFSEMTLPAASCGVSCEILRAYSAEVASATKAGSRYPPSPRLWRVLLAFIPAASYGVFGEGE